MTTEKNTNKWRFLTLTYRNDPYNVIIKGDLRDQYMSTYKNIKVFLQDFCDEYMCNPEYTDNGRIHWHILYTCKFGSRLKRLVWLQEFKRNQGFIKDMLVKNFIKCHEYITKEEKEMEEFFGFDPSMNFRRL